MTPWLCQGLSYDNQIWHRDSFQEGRGVCKLSLSYLNSNIVFRIWGGENLLLPSHRKPTNSGGTIVYNYPHYVRRRGWMPRGLLFYLHSYQSPDSRIMNRTAQIFAQAYKTRRNKGEPSFASPISRIYYILYIIRTSSIR